MAKFIDEAKIRIKAGDGGHGCLSFYRGPNKPKGGPDGGDGGKGGDVYCEGDPQLFSLLDFRYQRSYKAERGREGQGANKTGRKGEDLVIRLPLGTLIYDENNQLLADLTEVGQRELVCKGGRGGRGNWHFRSSTNQTPRKREEGGEGEEREISLELKSLCDVGLVGLPNAGKSSLLRALTPAKPEVASYPFTTLNPKLGIRQAKSISDFSYAMADIPGLIEGAHENKGLGHRFLRHIQRSKVLLYLIGLDFEKSLLDSYKGLQTELSAFDPSLLQKQSIVVINKIDLLENDSDHSDVERQKWKKEIESFRTKEPSSLMISVKTYQGLDELDSILQSLLLPTHDICYS